MGASGRSDRNTSEAPPVPLPDLQKPRNGEGVKKSSTRIKLKERVAWRSFRAQPLEIEALWHKPASTHIFIAVGGDP
jgi:hypothetical protein